MTRHASDTGTVHHAYDCTIPPPIRLQRDKSAEGALVPVVAEAIGEEPLTAGARWKGSASSRGGDERPPQSSHVTDRDASLAFRNFSQTGPRNAERDPRG